MLPRPVRDSRYGVVHRMSSPQMDTTMYLDPRLPIVHERLGQLQTGKGFERLQEVAGGARATLPNQMAADALPVTVYEPSGEGAPQAVRRRPGPSLRHAAAADAPPDGRTPHDGVAARHPRQAGPHGRTPDGGHHVPVVSRVPGRAHRSSATRPGTRRTTSSSAPTPASPTRRSPNGPSTAGASKRQSRRPSSTSVLRIRAGGARRPSIARPRWRWCW